MQTTTAPAFTTRNPHTGEAASGRAADHRNPATVSSVLLLAAALVATALIASSYAMSARATGGHTFYAVFWAGMLLFLLPAALALGRAATRRNTRCALVIAIGLFTYVPKYLRTPTGPLFHDELAHWREAQDIAAGGHLFQPNWLIPVIRDFPGLESAVTGVHAFTGLSVWTSSVLLVGLAHVLTLLGVYLLVEGLYGARIAGIAALIYSVNANFVYFDTQDAYQSLSVGIAVWTLICLGRALRATATAERWCWAAAASLLAAACVVTHHFSALVLGIVLAVVALLATRQARRPGGCPGWAAAWAVFGSLALTAALWVAFVAPATVGYLSPYLGPAVRSLGSRLSGSQQGSRQVFANTPLPGYEQWAALALPFIALPPAAAGLWHLHRHRGGRPERRPVAVGLAAFGLFYFLSLPFIITAVGAEGARRTWTFTFIGLAVLAAPPVTGALRRAARARPRTQALAAGALTAAFAVATVGGVAAGQSEDYRFPRPYAYGYDTRSITPEERALAAWLLADYGPGQRIVADEFTAQTLAAFARARPATPSGGLPVWQLYFRVGPPSRALAHDLMSGGYRFLVIDKQLVLGRPVNRTYFGPHEPTTASGRPYVIQAAALTQYDHYPWVSKVYDSPDYAVYRFDRTTLSALAAGG